MKLKNIVLLLLAVFFSSCLSGGDEEDDEIVHDDFDAAVVCPESGTNTYGMPNRGTFVDERDSNSYRYTTIGKRVWMAQNLRFFDIEHYDYDFKGSTCYYEEDSCAEKGFAYYDNGYRENACPLGWHLPDIEEWNELIKTMGGDTLAASRLKSSSGWKPLNPGDNGNGSDDCGFSVLPAKTTVYGYDGYRAYFVSSSPGLLGKLTKIFDTDDPVIKQSDWSSANASIRCVMD
ncbi:FISUMP domain-containing protein [uncultured Fibrobacter sp.]|uniref:FISUMP domain-containing protein n=1 Tax=uncultured Fibrobacter sp. TaxID=261512 RepID=UPI002620E7A7|nr:FISUMP domain-containing protein [uncultured Fibrobacter sp.]